MDNYERVVIIFAHPDDESFGTAGSIINFRKKGVQVTYLCGTLGEMGRNMGTRIFANRESLPKIREKELEDTCNYLDIDFELLGYHDKTLEYEDRLEMAQHIKGILERLEPDLVITHYPDYAVHPDHNALGAAAIKAVEWIEPEERPVVWASAIENDFEKDLGKPHIVHDITPIFDEKMQSILTHKSQAEGMLKEIDGSLKLTEGVKEDMKARLGYEQFFIWDFNE